MSTYLSHGLFSTLTCQFIVHLPPYPLVLYTLMRDIESTVKLATDRYVYNEYSIQIIISLFPYQYKCYVYFSSTLGMLYALLI
jgi:hypothetical protein